MVHYQIIVVDDDDEDQLIMQEYFEGIHADGRVKYLQNGQQVLDYLEAVTDDSLLPNLIILDLNMPLLNGTNTLLHIKRNNRFKNITVIILSTSENENEKRKCLSFGAHEYLVKPFTYEEGANMVRKFAVYLGKSQ